METECVSEMSTINRAFKFIPNNRIHISSRYLLLLALFIHCILIVLLSSEVLTGIIIIVVLVVVVVVVVVEVVEVVVAVVAIVVAVVVVVVALEAVIAVVVVIVVAVVAVVEVAVVE